MDDRRSHEERNFEKLSELADPGKAERVERQDIYVRAHTPARANKPWNRPWSQKWPKYCLVFDTETTIDPKQKLTFGCYRRGQLDGDGYRCIEEGLFYADDLGQSDIETLEKYV